MEKETRGALRGLVVLFIGLIAMLSPGPARGEYQMTPTTDGYAEPLYYDNTLPVKIIGWGSYDANATYGTATCSADSYTWAKPGTGDFKADAWGQVGYTWDWEGPPSVPAGGSLYWENDGDGSATVDGGTDAGESGWAYSYGVASSGTQVTAGSRSTTGGTVWASVEDHYWASGDAYPAGDPCLPHTHHETEDPNGGYYYYDITWNGYYDTTELIASGTQTFSVVGEADCLAWAYSGATGSGDADTDTTANAGLLAYVYFEPNP
jgi:hypothetical protein